MSDVLVTVPKGIWRVWIAEGDAAVTLEVRRRKDVD
jgi:hypothetical protein